MIFAIIALLLGGFLSLQYTLGTGDPAVWAALGFGAPAGSPAVRVAMAVAGLALLAAGAGLLVRKRRHLRIAAAGEDAGTRWLKWGFVFILTAILAWMARVEIDEISHIVSRPTDFGTFYRAAQAVLEGGNAYESTDGGYFYPPTFAYGFGALTVLPVAWASVMWLLLKLFMLAVMCQWAFALLDGHLMGPRARVLFLFGMLAATGRFWTSDLQFGNTNLVIAFLVLGCIHYDLRDRPPLSGLLLAAAMTIKVVPGVIVLWLVARFRWRTILYGVLAVAVLNGAPLITGPADVLENWRGYVAFGIRDKLMDDLAQPDNQSLWGALARALPAGSGALRPLWAVLSVAMLAGAFAVSYAKRASERRGQACTGALFAGLQLVVSPGSWVVHYVNAFLPMAVLLRLATIPSRVRTMLIAVFVMANFAFSISGWSRQMVRLSLRESWFLLALILVLLAIAVASLTGQPRHRVRTQPVRVP